MDPLPGAYPCDKLTLKYLAQLTHTAHDHQRPHSQHICIVFMKNTFFKLRINTVTESRWPELSELEF